MALARLHSGSAYRLVGGRFSRMSMAGVACILVSGMTMCVFYIGSWQAFYGTAYGVMVGAKISMFLMLLALGAGNFLVTERLRRDPATPVLRMRRFAEVEIGIGITIFFCAASLTSVPPGVDLTADRATWADVVDRDFTPKWPTLVSPDHDRLGIPALQAQLDREARARAQEPRAAFVEGSGELPPRNADDIAWSEYNHHWSGIFVFAIGVLALLNQAGLRWARQWPLVFLGLGAFLLVRSDPEVWPLGDIGLLESLRDVEVVQHRVFAALPIAFGLFEWGVRTGRIKAPWAAYVFPMICAGGGALLLTHSHAIANVKDQLLIEWTHTPLALAAIVAGWSRWLELRLPGRVARISAWVWPVCFVLIGVMLFFYREA
jgi:putative copper resistance protein D